MLCIRKLILVTVFTGCSLVQADAAAVANKSFQGKYKTTAHFCVDDHCEDQVETVNASFFVGPRQVHVYSGANKGLALPFGQRTVSDDGKSVWMVPTPAGFDETYARDGFTITHHYTVQPDGTCSVAVSVVKAPAAVNTTYRTEMESCKVADGNIFAAQ